MFYLFIILLSLIGVLIGELYEDEIYIRELESDIEDLEDDARFMNIIYLESQFADLRKRGY